MIISSENPESSGRQACLLSTRFFSCGAMPKSKSGNALFSHQIAHLAAEIHSWKIFRQLRTIRNGRGILKNKAVLQHDEAYRCDTRQSFHSPTRWRRHPPGEACHGETTFGSHQPVPRPDQPRDGGIRRGPIPGCRWRIRRRVFLAMNQVVAYHVSVPLRSISVLTCERLNRAPSGFNCSVSFTWGAL
jgi:hypothetical protein